MLGCLICMIDVWLGMIDAMLCVRCVLMCVCVCVCEYRCNVKCAFNRVKT